MPRQPMQGSPGGNVPQNDDVIVSDTREEGAVRREGQAFDLSRRSFQEARPLVLSDLPEPD